MQFNLEKGGDGYVIQNYRTGCVAIDGNQYTNSLIVFADRIIDNWPITSVDELTVDSLEEVIESQPEVFLLGTGDRQIFPPNALMVELARRQRSVDVMDSAAACRTYNVLASEFRQVAVALILPGNDQTQA